MLTFTLKEGKVVVDPRMAMIQEFTDIMEYGEKAKEPTLGNRMLLYIFYCCDLSNNNPMRDIDYRLKEEQAMNRALGPINKKKFTVKEKKMIDAGVDAYNFFNENSLERATMTYDQKIDEIRSLLDKVQPEVHAQHETHLCEACQATHMTDSSHTIEEVMEITGYVSNEKIIASFMKQLSDATTYSLKAAETSKKRENVGRVRGEKGSSLIERGVFRDDQG